MPLRGWSTSPNPQELLRASTSAAAGANEDQWASNGGSGRAEREWDKGKQRAGETADYARGGWRSGDARDEPRRQEPAWTGGGGRWEQVGRIELRPDSPTHAENRFRPPPYRPSQPQNASYFGPSPSQLPRPFISFEGVSLPSGAFFKPFAPPPERVVYLYRLILVDPRLGVNIIGTGGEVQRRILRSSNLLLVAVEEGRKRYVDLVGSQHTIRVGIDLIKQTLCSRHQILPNLSFDERNLHVWPNAWLEDRFIDSVAPVPNGMLLPGTFSNPLRRPPSDRTLFRYYVIWPWRAVGEVLEAHPVYGFSSIQRSSGLLSIASSRTHRGYAAAAVLFGSEASIRRAVEQIRQIVYEDMWSEWDEQAQNHLWRKTWIEYSPGQSVPQMGVWLEEADPLPSSPDPATSPPAGRQTSSLYTTHARRRDLSSRHSHDRGPSPNRFDSRSRQARTPSTPPTRSGLRTRRRYDSPVSVESWPPKSRSRSRSRSPRRRETRRDGTRGRRGNERSRSPRRKREREESRRRGRKEEDWGRSTGDERRMKQKSVVSEIDLPLAAGSLFLHPSTSVAFIEDTTGCSLALHSVSGATRLFVEAENAEALEEAEELVERVVGKVEKGGRARKVDLHERHSRSRSPSFPRCPSLPSSSHTRKHERSRRRSPSRSPSPSRSRSDMSISSTSTVRERYERRRRTRSRTRSRSRVDYEPKREEEEVDDDLNETGARYYPSPPVQRTAHRRSEDEHASGGISQRRREKEGDVEMYGWEGERQRRMKEMLEGANEQEADQYLAYPVHPPSPVHSSLTARRSALPHPDPVLHPSLGLHRPVPRPSVLTAAFPPAVAANGPLSPLSVPPEAARPAAAPPAKARWAAAFPSVPALSTGPALGAASVGGYAQVEEDEAVKDEEEKGWGRLAEEDGEAGMQLEAGEEKLVEGDDKVGEVGSGMMGWL